MHNGFGENAHSHSLALAAPLAAECARRVGEELPRLVRLLRQRVDAVPPPGGLTTGQYFVLALVRDGVTSPGGLAAHFAVSSPTITGLTARLAAKGLIGRALNDHDRRTVQLSVTEHGAVALTRMEAHMTACIAGLVAGLTETQQREIIAAMDSVHVLLRVEDEDEDATGLHTSLNGASGTKIAAPR